MTLFNGDLTVLPRVQLWLPNAGTAANPLLSSIIIPDASRTIVNLLNRDRIHYWTHIRTFDGVGNYQIVLPDYPVISITSVQMGAAMIQPAPLPAAPSTNSFGGYGYRFVPWNGYLPGSPSVVEMVNGRFQRGVQNIVVTYQAGYVVQNEPFTIPSGAGPHLYTVTQQFGIWAVDNGVTYSDTGAALTPTTTSPPPVGTYNPPADPPATLAGLGQYTFSTSDAGRTVLIDYSFIPPDLEAACIQLASETYSYRDRIGQMDKTLGGQETIRYLRGGAPGAHLSGESGGLSNLPPEILARIWPYVSVLPPMEGVPV